MAAATYQPKPTLGLTRAQTKCLEAIRDAIARDGIAPSYTELKAVLGLKSKSHIHQLVTQLEIRGAITRRIGSARSLAVTNKAIAALAPPLRCPCCGKLPEDHLRHERKL